MRLNTTAVNRSRFLPGWKSPTNVTRMHSASVTIMSRRFLTVATSKIGSTKPNAPTTFSGNIHSITMTMRKRIAAMTRTT